VRRLAVLAVLVPALAGATAAQSRVAAPATCPPAKSAGASAAEIDSVLRSGRDVWGERLLAAPAGPTYAGASRFLRPLFVARAAKQTSLTGSGAHYLPFGIPAGDRGAAGGAALHLADGGEIVARRVGGPSLTISVGAAGTERYGSCRPRLRARLAHQGLPILVTDYSDGAGVRYRQQSFAALAGSPRRLTSFVRVTAETSVSNGARIALRTRGGAVVRAVPPSSSATVHAAWRLGTPRPVAVDADAYDAALGGVVRYWERRLGEGMAVEVPEPRVAEAVRALRVQNLLLTWRYSIGNQYEQFSFPEGVDVAQVMGEQGYAGVARAILRTSLTRPDAPYPNWKMGEKLLGSATHYRLFHDRAHLAAATPALRRYVAILGRQIERNPSGMLDRERYSSDIKDPIFGLHSQSVVWAGLRGMAEAWQQTGQRQLAATCRRLATRLERGLRAAVRASQRRLPDGSLFVPVQLLGDEEPYRSLMEARLGSYWNLVMPYALASGLFAPASAEARGIWRYMQLHGSRLLGLVRAGAYALYGRDAPFPVSGTDQVYGINASRFLADAGMADELVLSLYGQLAAGMTPGTFVAGEAGSVTPLGLGARAMYLPPNGASNAAFLETLRLLLVHETPDRLELAHSTPRGWLRPGGRIAVANAPTRFGPVSFAIETGTRTAEVTVETPARSRPRALTLRLRLPAGARITSARLDGRPYTRFDAATGTIDLSGLGGTVRLELGLRR
jgi:hypothetical protein